MWNVEFGCEKPSPVHISLLCRKCLHAVGWVTHGIIHMAIASGRKLS